jgi:hypothetical protein
MRAYAAYRRPQNIEFYSIRQKKHPFSCVCAVFVVNLQAIIKITQPTDYYFLQP